MAAIYLTGLGPCMEQPLFNSSQITCLDIYSQHNQTSHFQARLPLTPDQIITWLEAIHHELGSSVSILAMYCESDAVWTRLKTLHNCCQSIVPVLHTTPTSNEWGTWTSWYVYSQATTMWINTTRQAILYQRIGHVYRRCFLQQQQQILHCQAF